MTHLLTTLAAFSLHQAPTLSPAQRLFEEGRAAMKANDTTLACALFQQSLTLEPTLGTLLNLATCLEQQGLIASAWVRFNEATNWAQRTHEGKREAFAVARAEALKPRLSWLSIEATSATRVEVDGVPLSLSAGVPASLPVDVGVHVVTLERPGFAPWRTEVEVREERTTNAVRVPELTPLDEPPPPPPPPLVERPTPPLPRREAGAGTNLAGVSLLSVGALVALAGGIGLGWSFAMYDQLQDQRLGSSTPLVRLSRQEFGTLQWVYPASWATAGVGAAMALAGIILVAAQRPTVVVVPFVEPGLAGASARLSF